MSHLLHSLGVLHAYATALPIQTLEKEQFAGKQILPPRFATILTTQSCQSSKIGILKFFSFEFVPQMIILVLIRPSRHRIKKLLNSKAPITGTMFPDYAERLSFTKHCTKTHTQIWNWDYIGKTMKSPPQSYSRWRFSHLVIAKLLQPMDWSDEPHWRPFLTQSNMGSFNINNGTFNIYHVYFDPVWTGQSTRYNTTSWEMCKTHAAMHMFNGQH